MKYAKDIQFGFEPNHFYFNHLKSLKEKNTNKEETWGRVPLPKGEKPSQPIQTQGNPFRNQLNNDNNDSVSPYLECSLKNDDVCDMLDDNKGKTNRDDDLAMMAC